MLDPRYAPPVPFNMQQFQVHPAPDPNPGGDFAHNNPHEGLQNAAGIPDVIVMDGGALRAVPVF